MIFNCRDYLASFLPNSFTKDVRWGYDTVLEDRNDITLHRFRKVKSQKIRPEIRHDIFCFDFFWNDLPDNCVFPSVFDFVATKGRDNRTVKYSFKLLSYKTRIMLTFVSSANPVHYSEIQTIVFW